MPGEGSAVRLLCSETPMYCWSESAASGFQDPAGNPGSGAHQLCGGNTFPIWPDVCGKEQSRCESGAAIFFLTGETLTRDVLQARSTMKICLSIRVQAQPARIE